MAMNQGDNLQAHPEFKAVGSISLKFGCYDMMSTKDYTG